MDPTASTACDLLLEYVERHNNGVRTGDFSSLASLFSDRATLVFESVAVGPFKGADMILQAFEDSPPSDEIQLSGVVHETLDGVSCAYAWGRRPAEEAGELHLTMKDGLISRLLVQSSSE